MDENPRSSRAGLQVFLIVLLGLGLRLSGFFWGQSYSYFGQGDGLEAYSVAVSYAQGEPRWQYLAQPNCNELSKLPGPLWTWFCLAGLRGWGSIEGVVFETILLNTVAIYLTWLLAKQTVGPRAALWAALLAATLPSAVYYSVGLYNPDVMPFFGALVFLALWQAVRVERSRQIFWVPLLLSIMPQFHMSAVVLWLAALVVLLLASARVNLRWLLAGLAVGAMVYLPYLRGDLAHGWQNTRGMLSGRDTRAWDCLKALSTPLNLLVNWVPQWTRSAAEYREIGKACFGAFTVLLAVNLLSALVAAVLLLSTFREIAASMRGRWKTPREAFRRNPGLLFLATLVAAPLACALLSKRPFHARYALDLFPALLALAGLAAAKATEWPGSGRFITWALVATTCTNVWFMPALYHHQGKAIDQGNLFVPSFRKLETVYQAMKTHAGAAPIKVNDTNYSHSFPRSDLYHHSAELIRSYVVVREKETASAANPSVPPIFYRLLKAEDVQPNDRTVAFRGNGIALKAEPSSSSQ